MARKNVFLNNYILLQSIFILGAIVLFLYLRQQVSILENNPKVINAAHRQMILAEDIGETCLMVDRETDRELRENYAKELSSLLSEYPKSKKVVFDYLHQSKLTKEDKKNVSDLFDKANKDLNRVCVSAQIITQKFSNEDRVKQLNEVIIKNKTRYIVSMGQILDVFNQQTNQEAESVRTKESFLFMFTIILTVFNLIVIISPIKNKLVQK